MLDNVKRIPGTTNVQIFGAKDYAMRIWIKPDRMTQLKVTVDEVTKALNEQNAQFAAGKIGQTPTGAGAGNGVHHYHQRPSHHAGGI